MDTKGRIPTWYPDDATASQSGDDGAANLPEIPDGLVDAFERVIEFAAAFPILIFALVFWILPRLFGGRSNQRRADAESRELRRDRGEPQTRPTYTSLDDLFRGMTQPAPSRPRARSRDDEDDGELRFGSAYGNEYGKTKFGFDNAEWGSAFPEKKDSDPRIEIG